MHSTDSSPLNADFLPNKYDVWPGGHHEWVSMDHFLETETWADGVHTIPLGSGPNIDLFFSGNPLASNGSVVPVFFNGAVTDRESKSGPFFSGRKIAATANLGFIAISDPSHALHSSLGLAWYAGSAHQKLQDDLTKILQGIASKWARELLFIGGSGGGFASLYYGHRLGEQASVLVWNPQTSITEYNESFAKNYFSHALGAGSTLDHADWKMVAKELAAEHGIETEVFVSTPRRLLYMQNGSDWHTPVHAVPFIKAGNFEHAGQGVYVAGENHVVWIANYGVGHAPLPEGLLLVALNRLLDSSSVVSDAMEAMAGIFGGHSSSLNPGWPRIDAVLPLETKLHALA